MRLKETKELSYLADRAGVAPSLFAENFTKKLLDEAIIEEGDPLGQELLTFIYEENIPYILQSLHDCGIEEVTANDYETAGRLIVMGDGDCPECGDMMEVTDGRYEWDTDGYVPRWEEKTCPCCGHQEIE